MKMIRWWGIGVFVGLIVILALVWFLLAPKLIASGIEDVGSEALGAKVEVGKVELNIFPLSVAIKELAAANPDKPMENLVVASEIKFAIDSSILLWKKVIIDELLVEGVTLGGQRQTSGALPGGRRIEKAAGDMVAAVDFEMPEMNVKDMVNKADLITTKRVAALKQSQEVMSEQWKKDLDKDAFAARTQAIEAEYKRLAARLKDNKLNLIKDRKAWKKLKKDIDNERKLLSDLGKKIKQDKELLNTQFKSVLAGPSDDKQAILNKAGLANGVDGLVDKYLGPQYTPWVKRALEMAKSFESDPKTEGETEEATNAMVQVGDKVYFKDHHQFPELLIKKIKLNGGDSDWTLTGQGKDLGYLPWLTGNPAKLNLKLEGNKKANLALTSDWASKQEMITQLSSQVQSWPLEKMTLMETEQGVFSLESGNLSADIKGRLTLENIDLNAAFEIKSPKLAAPQGLSGWQKSLATSISQQSHIAISISAKGTLDDPSIKVSSSLENLFKQAVGDRLKAEADKLSSKVKEAIQAKVGDLSQLGELSKGLDQYQSQLSNKDELLKGLLGKIKL